MNNNGGYNNGSNSSGGGGGGLMISVVLVSCIVCLILGVIGYFMYKRKDSDVTPSPSPSPSPTPTTPPAAPALPPAATQLGTKDISTTPPTPTPPALQYTYVGDNGTASGDTFCAGNWGSADGKAKNMKCDGGKTIFDPRGSTYTDALVDCGSIMSNVAGGLGHWAYACH